MDPAPYALALAIILFLVGFFGSFLPILPGSVFVFAGIAIHKLWLGEASPIPWWFVVVSLVLVILAQLIDFAGSYFGAKKFGATWIGALGALIGGIAGMIFFNLPGLILGPIIGAVGFELMNEREAKDAAMAGFGTVVGGLVAFIFKFGITCFLITTALVFIIFA